MRTVLLAWLLVQSGMQLGATERAGLFSTTSMTGGKSFTGSRQVSHSRRKTKSHGKDSAVNNLKTSSYYILDVNSAADMSKIGVSKRTIVLLGHQMTTLPNGDDSNDEDSSNNADVTDGDDSDFEIAGDDTSSGIDSLIVTDDEDENIPSLGHVQQNGGEDDDNGDVGESANIDSSESGSNSDDNNDSIDDNEDIENSDDDVEEGADENDDEELSRKNNSNSISELKKLWRNLILTAKNDQLNESTKEILSAIQHQMNENGSVAVTSTESENYRNVPLSSVVAQFPLLLRANGTDSSSFNRQLESQLNDPLALGQRALWMDQEFALVLKGERAIQVY